MEYTGNIEINQEGGMSAKRIAGAVLGSGAGAAAGVGAAAVSGAGILATGGVGVGVGAVGGLGSIYLSRDTEEKKIKREYDERIGKIQGGVDDKNKIKDKLKKSLERVKGEVETKIRDVDGLYTYFKDTYFYKEVDKEKEKIKNDTKLDVIHILSEYGNTTTDKTGKTYIPSEFQSEYMQLKTYIPELESLTFIQKKYADLSQSVYEKYRSSDDVMKQLKVNEELISKWNRRNYRGGSGNDIIRTFQLITGAGQGEDEINSIVSELQDETGKIRDDFKKQLGALTQLKRKKDEMIRKLKESGSGTSVKVIATLGELRSDKEGKKFDEIYQHISGKQLFVNGDEQENNVELFCSYGILRCRLEEIEIYLKKYGSISKKLKAILEKQKDIESYGTVSYSFLRGEIKQIYKIFQKYGLAGKSIGYTDPNRIWKIILETFGSKGRIDKLQFKDFEVLRGNDDAIEVFCTKNKLNSLEKRSFRLAIREILGELDKINKEKEQKLQKEKEKEEKKKQEKQKSDELKEKLKQDIKDSKDTEEGKEKKLEELDKIEKLEAERDATRKKEEQLKEERESKVQKRLRELQEKSQADQVRIDRLKQDKELVLKTMDSSLAELTSYKAGHSELVDQKRKILMDTIEKLKKKKEIQDKQYAELVLMNERNKSLLSEIKSEESKIIEGSKELKEDLQRMQEKEKLYLMERQKYIKRNKELRRKLDKQQKRTHRKTKDVAHSETRPISFTGEDKVKKRTKKKVKRKGKKKREKSFTETLKSAFVN